MKLLLFCSQTEATSRVFGLILNGASFVKVSYIVRASEKTASGWTLGMHTKLFAVRFVEKSCQDVAPNNLLQKDSALPSPFPAFLLFENSKAVADVDTKAVSKIDQKWRILDTKERRCAAEGRDRAARANGVQSIESNWSVLRAHRENFLKHSQRVVEDRDSLRQKTRRRKGATE